MGRVDGPKSQIGWIEEVSRAGELERRIEEPDWWTVQRSPDKWKQTVDSLWSEDEFTRRDWQVDSPVMTKGVGLRASLRNRAAADVSQKQTSFSRAGRRRRTFWINNQFSSGAMNGVNLKANSRLKIGTRVFKTNGFFQTIRLVTQPLATGAQVPLSSGSCSLEESLFQCVQPLDRWAAKPQASRCQIWQLNTDDECTAIRYSVESVTDCLCIESGVKSNVESNVVTTL